MIKELFRVEGRPISPGKFLDVQIGPSIMELMIAEYDKTSSSSSWLSPPLSINNNNMMLEIKLDSRLFVYRGDKLVFIGGQTKVRDRSRDLLNAEQRELYDAAVEERNKKWRERGIDYLLAKRYKSR